MIDTKSSRLTAKEMKGKSRYCSSFALKLSGTTYCQTSTGSHKKTVSFERFARVREKLKRVLLVPATFSTAVTHVE